jgi:hypothetical protein
MLSSSSLQVLPKFGATLRSNAYQLADLSSAQTQEVKDLADLLSANKAAFVASDAGKSDTLDIEFKYDTSGASAFVVSHANGNFSLKPEAGQTMATFMDAFQSKLAAFTENLISPEEKQAKIQKDFQTFVTKVANAIKEGDFELVPDSSNTSPAGGSFMMHGGWYTQTAKIQIEGQTYTVSTQVSKHGETSYNIQIPGTDWNSPVASVNYTVQKDPNGIVRNDRVGGLSFQSGNNHQDFVSNYAQFPRPTQVMLQNMMTKMDNLFAQLDSAGVLIPFQA